MDSDFAGVSEELWSIVCELLPKVDGGKRRGRPRVPDRAILGGIVFRLKTGCQWKALPNRFGSGSTCHRRFQQWRELGVFQKLFGKMVEHYDRRCGVQWEWACLDSAMVKAPKGGQHGPKPNGPRKTRRQTSRTHGWSRCSACRANLRCQRPR